MIGRTKLKGASGVRARAVSLVSTHFMHCVTACFCASALHADTTVTCWGLNSYEQCGTPASLTHSARVAGGYLHSVALQRDGSIICWGYNNDGACDVPAGLSLAIEVAAGAWHTIAITSDSTVACWGWNVFGQCDVPEELASVVGIAGGGYHTAAVTSDGSVSCWGLNKEGQCSVPARLGSVTHISAGAWHSVALKSNGTVACWGYNEHGQCDVPATLAGVVSIAAGGIHTAALTNDAAVVCWGSNDSHQCDVPAGLANPVSIAAGFQHTVALTSYGAVESWGANGSGQCTTPLSLASVVEISAGGYHTMALMCTTPTATRSSGNLGAIGVGAPREFAFEDLAPSVSPVTLTVRARADLDDANESLMIRLNGLEFATIFADSGNACAESADEVALTMTAEQFNTMIKKSARLKVRVEASASVDASECANGACELTLDYELVPIDCNTNGLEDSCEITLGANDDDNDAQLDDCERARGDFDLDGAITASDLSQLLAYWGAADPPFGDFDFDGVITAADLSLLMSRWGPLL